MEPTSLNSFLLLAQANPISTGEGEALTVGSLWDFVVKGGPTMLIIGACSLLALTIIIERLMVLRRRAVMPPDFLAGLPGITADRRRGLDYCRANGSPIANVLAAAFQRWGQPREAVEKGVQDAGQREMLRLRHRMRLLSALPQISTMLGLLGTVFGMIKTFQAVATSGQALGKPELLAKGIFEAWTNTAAGLLVAIPVIMVYQMLMGKIDSLALAMDGFVSDWLDRDGSTNSTPAPEIVPTRVQPSMPSVVAPSAMPATA